MGARAAAALAGAPFHRAFGPLLLVLAVLAQALLYEKVLRPIPTIASAYAVSTALGLIHGRGLTVQPEEAEAVRRGVGRFDDLLPLYREEAPRSVAHEPLPGVSLLFAAVALATGSLCLGSIVYLQMLIHGLGAWWLSSELRHWSGLAAALAGLGWAVFVPEFRSSLTPGYDSLPTLVYLGACLPLLRFGRGGATWWLAVAGLACGAGLWVRDYLFVLPAVLLLPLAWLRRPHALGFAAFGIPVALLAAGLASARAPTSGATHRMIRGGVWHTFWAGVGQFENDLGLVAEDESVRDFASRLDPGGSFRVPNYQYLPRYDAVLARAGRAYIAREWPGLIRNAVYRVGWLVFPAFAPSKQFAAGAMRALLVLVGVPLSALALLGFAALWRRDRFAALVLAAPILSLLPLAPYYFIAKIPTGAFFCQLSFLGFALDGWRLRKLGTPEGNRQVFLPPGRPPDHLGNGAGRRSRAGEPTAKAGASGGDGDPRRDVRDGPLVGGRWPRASRGAG